jgi:hypothetical protein
LLDDAVNIVHGNTSVSKAASIAALAEGMEQLSVKQLSVKSSQLVSPLYLPPRPPPTSPSFASSSGFSSSTISSIIRAKLRIMHA